MTNKKPAVFLFCALPCEAKSLIKAWKLNKLTTQPFPSYGNEACVLVVSGIGKAAMAGAIGHTMASHADIQLPIMLNFGIAGHANKSCGTAVLADKIIDSETNKSFYPQLAFEVPCSTANLISYPKPVTNYQIASMCDMEAAGFFELATRFSSSELIHSLKIVSDNTFNPADSITESKVIAWCETNLPILENLIEQLQALRQSQAFFAIDYYQVIFEELHFSATNSAKLKSLLQRWDVLYGGSNNCLQWRQANARSGKEMLIWLEKMLEDGLFML